MKEITGAASRCRVAVLGSSERIPIRASRPARDAPLMIAGVARGRSPGVIVGHRAFDGERAAIVVGDDQVEGRIASASGMLAAIKCRGVGQPSATTGASTSCP